MIVIPMMGRSSRFFDAGYTVPKYELPLAGKTVFDWVLKSFEAYFESQPFLFIVRKDFEGAEFVLNHAKSVGMKNLEIVELEEETRGQAETVYIGVQKSKFGNSYGDEPLVIFNADSFLTSFVMPEDDESVGGIIEVFEGPGDHWSFVKPGPDFSVIETKEKERISNLCSNGLYVFEDFDTFSFAFNAMKEDGGFVKGELYVAPMYNYLIAGGQTIKYRLVESEACVFCGTPQEYESLIESGWSGF